MVLLHHEPPAGAEGAGGGSHYDWMLARDEVSKLLTFRAAVRPDNAELTEVRLHQVPDHRRVYLEFEGELTGGRGRVTRVASGRCVILQESEDRVDIECRWDGQAETARWALHRDAPDADWCARRVTGSPPNGR